jgi:hypothetical protein
MSYSPPEAGKEGNISEFVKKILEKYHIDEENS